MPKKRTNRQITVNHAAPAKPEPEKAAVYPIACPRLLITLRVTGLLIFGLTVLAWIRPDLRVWGFHSIAFLPLPVGVILSIVALLSWTPFGLRGFTALANRLSGFRRKSALLWAVLAMAVFFALRVSIPILGDGALWVKELVWIGEFEARGKHVPGGRLFMRKEPLELGMHEIIFRGLAAMRSPDSPPMNMQQAETQIKVREQWFIRHARATYAYLSILAGGILVFLSVRFARRRLVVESRAPFLLVLLSGSGMMLFCGYVENYTWASLTLLAFLFAGLDDLYRPHKFPLMSMIALLLAVGFHLMNIILLPAGIFLLVTWWVGRRRDTDSTSGMPYRVFFGILIAVVVLGLAGYLYVKGWRGWQYILRLLPKPGRDPYAILYPDHVLDLLNLLALVLLPSLVLMVYAGGTRILSWTAAAQRNFLGLAALCGAALVVVFNPNLGMARDWDALATALWPAILLAAWVIGTSKLQHHRLSVMAAIAGFSLLITVPFILTNVFRTTAIPRYESLLRTDYRRSAYGWENLAIHYESIGDLDNRIRAWRAAMNAAPNPRYMTNLSVALRLAGRLDEAEIYAREGARRNHDYANQLVYLAQEHWKAKRMDRAVDLLSEAAVLDTSDKQVPKLLESVKREMAKRSAE